MEIRWRNMLSLLVSVLISATLANAGALEYAATFSTKGHVISHQPTTFTFQSTEDSQSLIITVRGLFYDDPKPPVPKGATYTKLWEHEIAQTFFANDQGQILHLTLSPYGHYLAATYDKQGRTDGTSVEKEFNLPLNVTTQISEDRKTWYGVALVPTSYLPKNVSHFNVFYARGVRPGRQFEMYTIESFKEGTDEIGGAIDLDEVIPGLSEKPRSEMWDNILEKPYKYVIRRSWNNTILEHPSSVFEFDSVDNDTLIVKITSQFYNDPPPNVPDGTRTAILWKYETAEIFFLNDYEQYFQVMVGPRGHYFSALYEGKRNKVRMNVFLDVKSEINPDRKTWTAVVKIPREYLPTKSSKFNAYYSHGMGESRRHEAYSGASPSEKVADYHNLSYFAHFDMDLVLPGYSKKNTNVLETCKSEKKCPNQSDVWIDVLQRPLNYQILTTFDNKKISHKPTNVSLDITEEGSLNITFMIPPGKSNDMLAEKAVVLFGNDDKEYFVLEIDPFGGYKAAIYYAVKFMRTNHLKLEVMTSSNEENNSWNGSAIIPVNFLPPHVSKWNAYYEYGPELSKQESLGPSYHHVTEADYHDPEAFVPIDLDRVVPNFQVRSESPYWKGPLIYDITTKWNGDPVYHTPTTFTIGSSDNSLRVDVYSLFRDDPAPPAPENSSYVGIWQYELVEIFFANDRDEYLQVELGPYGQYQVMMLAGERNYKRYQLPIGAISERTGREWNGVLYIPMDYLPEGVTKFNCFSSFGSSSDRTYEAFAPAPPEVTQPDFHRLSDFAPIDLDEVVPDLSTRPMSNIWKDALEGKITYQINTLWNGAPINHDPIIVSLSGTSDELYLDIDAPFFDDPAPNGKPGEPFNHLWEYEVVEAFFLNDLNQYLEVEVGPYGQHLVLLLWTKNDTYNQMRHSLPLTVTTNITGDRWTGRAVIPADYFPPRVTRFNAYTKHLTGADRQEESLYPQDPSDPVADFHALKYFKPIDFNTVLPNQSDQPISQLWEDTIQGIFRYNIKTEWNSVPISHDPTVITLEGFEGGVEMNVSASFFNDPAPDGEPGKPFYGLWNYEVVEMFFLNDNDEYLEVEIGPYGQHIVLMLKGERNTIKHSLALDYVVTQRENGTVASPGSSPESQLQGVWQGSALIPPEYFPPNVTRMNAYAIHGVDPDRVYESLYPAPKDNPNYPAPDFHKLDLFQKMDFEFLVVDNSQYSQLWLDAIANATTTDQTEILTPVDEESPVEVSPELHKTADQKPSKVKQEEPFVVVLKKPLRDSSRDTTTEITVTDDASTTPYYPEASTDTIATVVEETATEATSAIQAIEESERDASVDESTQAPDSTTTVAEEEPTTETVKSANLPKPELVKEARRQDITKPTGNLFRPLVIRPQAGVKPVPSKLDEKDQEKFVNNPTLNNFPQPHFYPRPHFPPPNFFNIPQPHLNNNPNSPYSTGFQLPVFPNTAGQFPPLPPQPHLNHVLLHQQNVAANLAEQQVVDSLPTPSSPKNSLPKKEFKNPSPVPLPIPEVVAPEKVEVEVPVVKPISPLSIPSLPEANNKPIQERKLIQPNSALVPEQNIQAIAPQQTDDLPLPASIPTQTLIPSAVPSDYPPPHNLCYYQGLHVDPNRCQIFHECAYENHEWKVYTWRCPRGKYYDSEVQNCVAGFC